MKKKVVVGMSGGVDSSVAAALLLEQGYEVIGITMQLMDEEFNNDKEAQCCSLSSVNDARLVCDILGIRYYVLNFKEVFSKKVIRYFIDEYIRARTPNPCIACNKYIKFDEFLKKSKEIGADFIATGHYAKIVFDKAYNRYLLKKSNDTRKDQTYVLYNMTQQQLSHTLMPLGDYKKDDIRKIAENLKLPIFNKSESQEICFIPDNDYGRFIKNNQHEKITEGYFKDIKGNILGKHKGIIYYTIGQRKGLGIAFGKPMFVVDINPLDNSVILGEEKEVFKDFLNASEVNIIPFENLDNSMNVTAKIRYTAKETEAILIPQSKSEISLKFKNPQRAITRGQSVVFYKDDILIGGGIIN